MTQREHERPETKRLLESQSWRLNEDYMRRLDGELNVLLDRTSRKMGDGRMLSTEQLAEGLHRLCMVIHCQRKRLEDQLEPADLDDALGVLDLAAERRDFVGLYAMMTFRLKDERLGGAMIDGVEIGYLMPLIRRLLRALDKQREAGGDKRAVSLELGEAVPNAKTLPLSKPPKPPKPQRGEGSKMIDEREKEWVEADALEGR